MSNDHHRAILEADLIAVDQKMKEVNARIPKLYPIGTRVEVAVPTNRPCAQKERVKGEVIGFKQHWRLDLIIRTDAGKVFTKVVSRFSLAEINIIA